MLLFPEGTYFVDETKKKSDVFAAANSLPPYDYVLHPRVSGFSHVFGEMRRLDMIDCVQDVTIAYRGGHLPFGELDLLNGLFPHEVHFYVDKFVASDILKVDRERQPQGHKAGIDRDNKDDDAVLERWLCERWRLKEQLLER